MDFAARRFAKNLLELGVGWRTEHMLGFPTKLEAAFKSPTELEAAVLEQRIGFLEQALAEHIKLFGHTSLSLKALPNCQPGPAAAPKSDPAAD